MPPLIPPEMIQSGIQLVVYFAAVTAAVLSFLVTARA